MHAVLHKPIQQNPSNTIVAVGMIYVTLMHNHLPELRNIQLLRNTYLRHVVYDISFTDARITSRM
jgi:hypothetical protein